MIANERLMNITQLSAQFGNDELAAVKFMQVRGLIHRRRVCPRCGGPVVLQQRKDRDDVRWRCNTKRCQKEFSPKTGTWFQGCEHPVRTLLLFSRALTTLYYCKGKYDMKEAAAVKLNAAMRRVAEEWLLKNPVPLGGSALTEPSHEDFYIYLGPKSYHWLQ
uniref:Transposase zinc-ribbon domain-containing protein n=1 Tax=Trichuris muris TaxID=70415 RepID=A0A5S6QS66_TRIMR